MKSGARGRGMNHRQGVESFSCNFGNKGWALARLLSPSGRYTLGAYYMRARRSFYEPGRQPAYGGICPTS